jgi:hypothetical protein
MSLHLTPEIESALQSQGSPLRVVGADDRTEYVIVSSTQLERIRWLLDDSDFALAETYAAQSRAAGVAGWDDPEMDVYDAHRPQA